MTSLTYAESVFVARSPDELYDLISDVTRMGQWSPICRACWWDQEPGDGGPHADAWFNGRNETPSRTWETRAQVVVAERGREFSFEVGGGWVRWSYFFAPAHGGTTLTENWEFFDVGQEGFKGRYGDDAAAQIADRTEAARTGIPVTLAGIKAAAEAS